MKAKKTTTKTVTRADIRELLRSDDVLDRLEGVGCTIYGTEWITALALTLGCARQTLHNWLSKASAPPANLDEMLLAAIQKATVAAEVRARAEAERLAAAAVALKKRVRNEG